MIFFTNKSKCAREGWYRSRSRTGLLPLRHVGKLEYLVNIPLVVFVAGSPIRRFVSHWLCGCLDIVSLSLLKATRRWAPPRSAGLGSELPRLHRRR